VLIDRINQDQTAIFDLVIVRKRFIHAISGQNGFGKDLSKALLDRLCNNGYLLNVQQQQLTHTGVVDRDVFFVVEGKLSVFKEGQKIATLSQGDVFGEIGLFRKSGERTADVYADGPGQLFVLRHRFLQRLERSHPELAIELYQHLIQRMTERLLHIETSSFTNRLEGVAS